MGLAATTPASGTVSPSSPTLQFQGGPYAVSNPSSPIGENPPVCSDLTPCGEFALTINIPAGDTNAYDLNVSVKWTESGQPTTQAASNSDYDIFIYKGTAPTGESMGAQGPNANPQDFSFRAAAGNYTIYVVPYDVAPDVPFTATVTLAKVEPDVAPTPVPVPPGTPTFTAYMSPAGLGDDAGEPSIGANWRTGRIMYYGGFMEYVLRVTFDDTKLPAQAHWEKRDLLLAATPRLLGDPILFTDRETGRTFISQLEGGTKQNTMDITDDDGDTLQLSVGSGVNSGYDHQTLGGGPFAPGMSGNGYKNSVYYCAQDAVVANCAISQDGGVTFGPAVPISNITQCTAIHGHVQVAPDGTAYVPDRSCGGEQGVIVSENNGLTWAVRKATGSTAGEWDPAVGVAADGTIYFGYNGSDGHARVQVSHDKGQTWTKPYDVGAQLGIKNSIFPAVVAGDPERAAFAFIGTTTGGNYNANDFAGTWYLYVASTLDGGQTWNTVNATPNDPVQRGRVCTDGTTCALPGGGGSTRNLLDFMGATVDREGRVLVGYADGCITAGCVQGADRDGDGKLTATDNDLTAKAGIARQSGGLRMFKTYDTPGPTPTPTPVSTQIEDDDARVSYSDGWHLVSGAGSAGHFRYHTGRSPNHFATLDFTVPAGQTGSITYYFARSPKGGSADLYLDGALRSSVSYKGAGGTTQKPEFSDNYSVKFDGLAAGSHRLEVKNLADVVYVDRFVLKSAGSTATPSSGPGMTTNQSSSVAGGQSAASGYQPPANACSFTVTAESSLVVPFQLVIVSPAGLTLQTINSSNGIATVSQPVSAGGAYAVKVVNLSLGPLQVTTTTTPTVGR